MRPKALKLIEDSGYVEPEIDRTIRPSDPTKDPIITIKNIRLMTGFGLAEAKAVNDYMKLIQAAMSKTEDGRVPHTLLTFSISAARGVLETL